MVRFWRHQKHLLIGDMSADLVGTRERRYARDVHQLLSALNSCIGLIDGYVLDVGCPGDFEQQNAAHIGQKRKDRIKY